MSFTGQD
jgi:hypothetical protein